MKHIYIYPSQQKTIVKAKTVKIGDIAQLQGPNDIIESIKKIPLMNINSDQERDYLVTIMQIISKIHSVDPEVIVEHFGPTDIIISYKNQAQKENKILTILKVIAVCIILMCGGAVAIMTFHTDTQLPSTFNKLYYIFIGDNHTCPHVIEIPYAIGVALGITVFFNHFSKITFTGDPTPIEVEMTSYQKQVDECRIDVLKQEQEGND